MVRLSVSLFDVETSHRTPMIRVIRRYKYSIPDVTSYRTPRCDEHYPSAGEPGRLGQQACHPRCERDPLGEYKTQPQRGEFWDPFRGGGPNGKSGLDWKEGGFIFLLGVCGQACNGMREG
jgi:hypothetical protein